MRQSHKTLLQIEYINCCWVVLPCRNCNLVLDNEGTCCERHSTCCDLQQPVSGALQVSVILHMQQLLSVPIVCGMQTSASHHVTTS